MGSLSATFLYQDRCFYSGKPGCSLLQKSFIGQFPARKLQIGGGLSNSIKRYPKLFCSKPEKKEEEEEEEEEEPSQYVYVDRPPYTSYFDSNSGRIQPASGSRAAIPGQEYWSEGTADRVRAARAPGPTGKSSGTPSRGKKPGSRRKKYKASASSDPSEVSTESNDATALGVSKNTIEEPKDSDALAVSKDIVEEAKHSDALVVSKDTLEEPKDSASEFVVYQTEKEEELDEYELDKRAGRSHPFIDPKVRRTVGEPLSSEELWWQWREPKEGYWSRWQRRRPDVETAFVKAMAEKGEVKIYGEHPTLAEASLYRARRHLFKEERIKVEADTLERIGPVAYYSEWVAAWTRDTSREAIQKHFEETGEDENDQLLEMFSVQTAAEYHIMAGTDVRVPRDPLAMRMREDQIKQIWGGDPVYPTVNYIRDPNEVCDFRGPDFHEPTPEILDYLMELGVVTPREEFEEILEKEREEEVEQATDIDEAMAQAVDIGEQDDDEEEENVVESDDEEEKITRNWSVLKSTPELRNTKGKPKPKKQGPLSLKEAIDDSENLTDFLLDFDENE